MPKCLTFANMTTKGLSPPNKGKLVLREDSIVMESVRDGLTVCCCRYRLRKYHVFYCVHFGDCEEDNGRITANLMRTRIITGIGQMERLIKRLHDKGLIERIEPAQGKRGVYYLLTELGRNVRTLYLTTYRERYARLIKHIAKHSGDN